MTDQTNPTQPVVDFDQDNQVYLAVAATYKDPHTGRLLVHHDLVEIQAAYLEEEHIPPMKVTEKFGDVESFVDYVARFALPESSLLTWNARGLRALVDYASAGTDEPGRCQWLATMPFTTSIQWQNWTSFASGQSLGQKIAVERLEDLGADIVEPKPADLMGLLRSLRSSVNAKASAELRPDGTTSIAFERDSRVAAAKDVDLPPTFKIAIPILKGHLNPDGSPVLFGLDVRVRVSVDDSAKLALRFTIPDAELALERVYAERVAAAKALLGETFALLRASDS